MTEVTITLPYPPSVNHYKRPGQLIRTKNGKIYQPMVDTDATKRFYYEVWMKIQQLKATEGLKSFSDSTISMVVSFYPPDKTKRDLDNNIKPRF